MHGPRQQRQPETAPASAARAEGPRAALRILALSAAAGLSGVASLSPAGCTTGSLGCEPEAARAAPDAPHPQTSPSALANQAQADGRDPREATAPPAGQTQRDRGNTATAGSRPKALSPLGLSTSAEASRNYRAFLPLVQRAGAKTLRLFGSWPVIEPENDRFDFAEDDARVALAAAHGVAITGMLNHSAAWALPEGTRNVKTMPVTRLAEWSDYVRHVVRRYRGKVDTWEVWNEPNTAAFNAARHSPAAYATLVRAACKAAKAENPHSRVAVTTANYDVRFLSLVIDALAAADQPPCFDFIAVHPYELVAALAQPHGEAMYLHIVDNLRKMLARHAPAKKNVPIWFTELGMPVEGNRAGTPDSQKRAADLLVKAYTLGLAQGVAQLQWFEVKDAGGSQRHGLLDDDLSPRLSYTAYRALAQALGPHPEVLGFVPLGPDREGYGILFRGAAGRRVLAAWMPSGQTSPITLPAGTEAIEIHGGKRRPLPAGKPYPLTATPVLLRLPEAGKADVDTFVARAKRTTPLPWGFGRPHASVASLDLGRPDPGKGLALLAKRPPKPHGFADGQAGVWIGRQHGNRLYFALDPRFADYNTREVYVRVTARTVSSNTPGTHTGMNLWYQPVAENPAIAPQYPYRSLGKWYTVPDDGQWHTHTWRVTGAMFVNTFGYGFYLQVDRSVPFVIGKVEVSKAAFPERKAASSGS